MGSETGVRCGCPGEYEERTIVHTVRHRGEIVVIEGVPAEVCSVCGDVLLTPETVRRIKALLEHRTEPGATAPLYQYA
ncbi:MAG: YgiT-type zinc finger protein [Armatimonadia bacterium]|nr:YgiT-type zinc finger protein [Armatimonadia bacterium]